MNTVTTVPIIQDVGLKIFAALAHQYRASNEQKLARAMFLAEMICPVKRWAHSNDIIAIVQVAYKDVKEILNSSMDLNEAATDVFHTLADWLTSNDLSIPR